MNLLLLFCFIPFVATNDDAYSGYGSDAGSILEKELRTELFRDYDKLSIPVINASTSLDLLYSIELKSLVYFNQKDEKIKFNALTTLIWQDEYLNWLNNSKYKDINYIFLPANAVWQPDLELYNAGSKPELFELYATYKLYKNGLIVYNRPTSFSFSCKLQLHNFPFDTQTCTMLFGSWKYPKATINLRPFTLDELNSLTFVPVYETTLNNEYWGEEDGWYGYSSGGGKDYEGYEEAELDGSGDDEDWNDEEEHWEDDEEEDGSGEDDEEEHWDDEEDNWDDDDWYDDDWYDDDWYDDDDDELVSSNNESYNGFIKNFRNIKNMSIDPTFSHNEWEIANIEVKHEDIKYLCCPNDLWPNSEFTITLRRNPQKYVILIIMSIFITLSSLTINLLDVSNYKRTYVLVFIPLTLIWLQMHVSSAIPVIEYSTKLESIIQLCFYVTIVSAFESGILYNLILNYPNNSFLTNTIIAVPSFLDNTMVVKDNNALENTNSHYQTFKTNIHRIDTTIRVVITSLFIVYISVLLGKPL